ncbi:FKBP-type peptidyl-prolyl cis-trans isomerase [Amphibiibacter pelophylacis]|uniref:Peptidylprolyl isomerase n=1 Tax=Amphibiibacter pelophylacis TaxID=1799477 RepID=A0ACC6P3P2_9BURK
MNIRLPCVVTLSWRMTDASNEALADCDTPREVLLADDGPLLPALQQVLVGQTAGFETRVQLEPHQAFGDYDAQGVCIESRTLFAGDIEAGQQLRGLPEGHISSGMPLDALYTITEIYDEHVVLDANHPLAGMALRFDLKVHAVREATDADLSGPLALGPDAGDVLAALGLEVEASDGWASVLVDLPRPTLH